MPAEKTEWEEANRKVSNQEKWNLVFCNVWAFGRSRNFSTRPRKSAGIKLLKSCGSQLGHKSGWLEHFELEIVFFFWQYKYEQSVNQQNYMGKYCYCFLVQGKITAPRRNTQMKATPWCWTEKPTDPALWHFIVCVSCLELRFMQHVPLRLCFQVLNRTRKFKWNTAVKCVCFCLVLFFGSVCVTIGEDTQEDFEIICNFEILQRVT